MRLLICAGGTGGGVYPALAVLHALKNKDAVSAADPLEVLWVGGKGGMEAELVKRMGVPFETIFAAGVHGVGARALPGNLIKLGRGLTESRRILRRFRPDVLFFTGGYLAAPMGLAGRKIPTLLYVPDIEPGLALKTLARFADHIALSADASRSYFQPQATRPMTVSGYPTRPDLKSWSREEALRVLGLSQDMPTLLAFGGSRGARSINRALLAGLPRLLEEMQVVHISGQLDWPEVEAASKDLSPELAVRYRPYAYLHNEMGAALSAADLVVSRAGASTLGEFPLFGLPAILVPYPYAWRYQQVNAEYLARSGAAVILQDGDLPEQLLPQVQELIRDRERRDRMQRAMGDLAQPQAAERIADLLQNLATGLPRGRI